jgi:hypothetical protein
MSKMCVQVHNSEFICMYMNLCLSTMIYKKDPLGVAGPDVAFAGAG